MEFQIISEPQNLIFSELEVGELFMFKGSSSVCQVVRVFYPDTDKVDIGYIQLSVGVVKVVNDSISHAPVLEVELVDDIKIRIFD